MPIHTQIYDNDPNNWIEFEYIDYWDIPRGLYLKYKGLNLVFDAPFLKIQDEYSYFYIIYLNEIGFKDWKMEYKTWEISNIISCEKIIFDETRRKYIFKETLDIMFANYEWPNKAVHPSRNHN